MLHDHRRDGTLWSGICDRCTGAVWPHIEGTKEDAEREIVARGWELDASGAGGKIRCVECARRAREVRLDNHRGVRRR